MKSVSAKAAMRRDIVQSLFGSSEAGKASARAVLLARSKGEKTVTQGNVKVSTRKASDGRFTK